MRLRERRAAVLQEESRRVKALLFQTPPLPQLRSPLLDDVVENVIALLPHGGLVKGLAVCRQWHEMLGCERLWEQMCRAQWEGAVSPVGCLWHRYLQMLVSGEALHQSLKSIPEARCGQGHLLLRFATEVEGFHCDGCGRREIPIGTTLWGCRLCNYDICVVCHQEPSKKAVPEECCPSGHRLQSFVTSCGGANCDACGRRPIPLGKTMWGCRTCNYDKCWNCYRPPRPAPTVLASKARNYIDAQGWTVLHHACRMGFTEVVQRLLESRANIDSPDLAHGFTPLMVGATHGQAEICSLLLTLGASADCLNKHGSNALDCARRWGHTDLENLFTAEDTDEASPERQEDLVSLDTSEVAVDPPE